MQSELANVTARPWTLYFQQQTIFDMPALINLYGQTEAVALVELWPWYLPHP